MKPGKRCKKSGKIAYASYDEAIRKAMVMYSENSMGIHGFSAYQCRSCKCWHITTKEFKLAA